MPRLPFVIFFFECDFLVFGELVFFGIGLSLVLMRFGRIIYQILKTEGNLGKVLQG